LAFAPRERRSVCTTHRQLPRRAHETRANAGPCARTGHRIEARALVRALQLRADMHWDEEIIGGAHWSGVLRRGSLLRLTARGDDANVAALFYSREQPLERYNMADTLKAQHTAHLTTGCV
jgi:uncharacterized protein YcgI (DUF1989 family)